MALLAVGGLLLYALPLTGIDKHHRTAILGQRFAYYFDRTSLINTKRTAR